MLNPFGIIATCAPSPKGEKKRLNNNVKKGDFVEKYMWDHPYLFHCYVESYFNSGPPPNYNLNHNFISGVTKR